MHYCQERKKVLSSLSYFLRDDEKKPAQNPASVFSKTAAAAPRKITYHFFPPPICENRVWHVFFPPFFAGNQCTRECFIFSLNPFFPRKKNIPRRGKITGSRKYVGGAGLLLPCVRMPQKKERYLEDSTTLSPHTKKEKNMREWDSHTHTLLLGKSGIFFLPSSIRGKREREKIRESLRCDKRNWRRRRRS